MNLEGKILANRYEILQKIGTGGMSTVYKAKCLVLNRYVAVKILKEEFISDLEFVKRFNAEAQSVASLVHGNIVSVYDVGNEDNIYYIIMELINGKTLKDIIVEGGVLSTKWAIDVTIQIASALDFAHRKGIIHRDIKPHNIIITEDGIAKVTDFGIAKAVSNSTITTFGTTIGSVHYFSPEHARGGYTDEKSDLYSLGVVLYEMVTGRVPFNADTPVSIALKHIQELPIEPIEIDASIPQSINNIIMKAMQKEPINRYQSAIDMIKDLKLALKNPDGEFVNIKNSEDETQTIVINKSTISDNKKHIKKKNKFAEFLSKHKILKAFLIFMAVIVLFFATMFAVIAVANASKPKEVVLPNLVGVNYEEAKVILDKLKIKIEVLDEEFNLENAVGVILKQEPQFIENYNIKENSTIKLTISKGKEIVKLEKIVGKTYEEALQILSRLGLEIEKIEEKSTTIPEGTVIRQEPAHDIEVEAKSVVKAYVSVGRGIAQIVVPSVVGKTEEIAKKSIVDAKLKVGATIKYEQDYTKTTGIVLTQDIDAGKTVDEQSIVNITVNKLPETTKEATININFKTLIGYASEYDENGVIKPVGKSNLKVTVESEGTEEIATEGDYLKNTDKIAVKVSGKGEIKIKIFVDGYVKTTRYLNLNTQNTLDI